MGKIAKKSKWLQKVKNNIIFYAARATIFIAKSIPLAIGLKIGAAIGGAAWHLLAFERNCAMVHLKLAFPEKSDKELLAIGKESLRSLGRGFFEIFHFDDIFATLGHADSYIEVIGIEHFENAVKNDGAGAMAFTGHIGNWELMVATVSKCGFKCNTVVRNLYDPRLDKLLNDHRLKHGYVPMTRGGDELVADIANVFAKNELLGLLIDQDTRVRSVFADFFGAPAKTPSGVAYLALMAQKDIHPCFNYRRPDGKFVVHIHPPLIRPQSGDMKADIQKYTEMMNESLCDHIRRHPDQWVWLHRRWKTRPEGEPKDKHPAPRPKKPYKY
jgi:Kdo2-lipid IVA lauroyltransferase/acyltransferase